MSNQAGANAAEKKNEELASALLGKISALKSVSLTRSCTCGGSFFAPQAVSSAVFVLQVTISINEEAHEQNKALEMMQSGMGATDSL